ncbi:LysR family transcriptional regulator [Mesorhizobium sp. BAC0120]|uniref:LysR family transcriptional regulator n=1 Tax=Mesorhizobium sp. BAC0120 TaxID=3090670 RepID=UPI00298CC5C3|nr:LysR family transcriptional regulator [Mesorhizobium sp. BAC0120]MDW6023336.1 LysR family transcriptional regulator [Mesorhizobium sp. BAC0120]
MGSADCARIAHPLASLIQTLAVAEYLNFRHAASALGAAQSSVSARVKALEEDVGILLFERHARGVRLTEAGRHFVERIASGVVQLDHAVKTAGMAAMGKWGRLRIARGTHGQGREDCYRHGSCRSRSGRR